MNRKTLKALIRLIIKLIVISIISLILFTFIIGVHVCHSNDMAPMVKDGDLVITYKIDKPYKDDIVVYRKNGKKYFGRIVAVPGDTINFDESGYLVNGSYPFETVFYQTTIGSGDIVYPLTLGEGEYFVLADYRIEGLDSRTIGTIKDIDGKVVLLLRRRGF